MLDDLRNSATYDDDFETPLEEEARPVAAGRAQPFLGMTAGQRFVIALLLLFMVCMLGSFFLLITERIVPPLF